MPSNIYDFDEIEPKISKKNALKDLRPFLKRCNVNTKKITDPSKKESVEGVIDIILEGIMEGFLEIKEIDGEYNVTQHIEHKSEKSTVDKIVYREPRGKEHMSVNDEDSRIKMGLSLMASISETNGADAIIKQLRSNDLSRTEALSTVFS